MNIKPLQEKILYELSVKQNYTVYLIITAIITLIGGFASFSNSYIVTLIVILLVGVFNTKNILDRLKLAKERITDISSSEINIANGYLYVHQTVKDTYEVCDILMAEIDSIIEDEKTRAFYIKLKENKTYSKIEIDENMTTSKIFKVNGEQYDREEFLAAYEMIIEESEARVEVLEKKNWQDENKTKEFLKITLPYASLLIIAVVHLFIGMY